jgi:hypothetical protein
LLAWPPVCSIAAATARAAPAEAEEAHQTEEAPDGAAEKEFSFGLRFVDGVKYFVTEHWAVLFEFGYSFIPGSDIVEHELSDSYLGAYFF